MKFLPRDVSVAVVLTLIGTILHVTLRQNTISLTPLPLLLSVCMVWLLPTPGYYLLALAVTSELFSWLPPGVMSAVTVIPMLIYRLRRATEVDISFTFTMLLITSVTLQVLVLALPLVLTALPADTLRVSSLPWFAMLRTIAATTAVSWLLCVGLNTIFPTARRRAVSTIETPLHWRPR